MCDYNPLADSMYSTSPVQFTSNPAIITQSVGGVGHNVTLAAHYMGSSVMLSSVIADDLTGRSLLDHLEKGGLRVDGIRTLHPSEGVRTAQYVAVNDKKKDLVVAMADMAILQIPSVEMTEHWELLISSHKPKWVVVDSNWSPALLSQVISIANNYRSNVAFEPVSVQKSMRIFHPDSPIIQGSGVIPNHCINLATPNALELETMYRTARDMFLFESNAWWEIANNFDLSGSGSRDKLIAMTSTGLVDQGVPQQMIQLLPYIPSIVTKLGDEGSLLAYLIPQGDAILTDSKCEKHILGRSTNPEALVGGVYLRLFPPAESVPPEEIVSVNGVGDTMLGVLIAGLVKGDRRLEDLIPVAQQAAVLTLKSPEAVSSEILGMRAILNRKGNS